MKKIFFGLFLAVISVVLVQVGCDPKATPAGVSVPAALTTAPIFSTFKSGLNTIRGLAMDSQGNIYYDYYNYSNGKIYKITPSGVQSPITGSGAYYPRTVAVDSNGAVYMNEGNPGRILKVVNGSASVLTTVHHCVGMAVKNGTLYFTSPSRNSSTNTLYSMPTAGGTVKTIVGGFSDAHGVALDNAGNVYVADASAGTIVKVSTSGAKTNFATGLTQPWGITVDNKGNVFVTDYSTGDVDMFTPSGAKTVLTTYCSPRGIVVDNKGGVYVADSCSNVIYKISFPSFSL